MKYTKADREWATLIKNRANWKCQRCGKNYSPKSQGLHAAHIVSRRFKRTRTDLDNGVALCYGCHSWAHRNPLEFVELITELYGEGFYEALKKKARGVKT